MQYVISDKRQYLALFITGFLHFFREIAKYPDLLTESLRLINKSVGGLFLFWGPC